MISNVNTVLSMTPGADHRNYEGYFVVLSGGNPVVCSSASVAPFGLLLEGENTDGFDSVEIGVGNKVVKVKLSGTVTKGAYGQLANDGTVVTDATTSTRILVCRFLEAGVSGDLVDAVLITPVTYS